LYSHKFTHLTGQAYSLMLSSADACHGIYWQHEYVCDY